MGSAALARVPSSRSLSTALTLNGGLARTKSKRPVALCRIVVVADRLADVGLQTVDGEVHAAQLHGVGDLLLPMDGEFGGRILAVLGHEAGALDEHAARSARRVEDAAVERLQHLDQQADDAGRRVELAALWPSVRANSPRKYS